MARRTSFDLQWRVLKDKRTLLIRVASDTSNFATACKFGLLWLKTAVCVVTVAAFHRAFQNFVPERFAEMRLNFAVARNTKLLLVVFKHRRSGIHV
jgi:hypothetical protein